MNLRGRITRIILEKAQLAVGEAGHFGIAGYAAGFAPPGGSPADNSEDAFFGDEKFFPGQQAQGVVETQAAYFRPVVVALAEFFVAKAYQFRVSSFGHGFVFCAKITNSV
jgi:hypothetical protein